MGRMWYLVAVAGLLFGVAGAARDATPGRAQEAHVVEVTNSGDSGSAVCPDSNNCTLRMAIILINADETADSWTITFKPSVFPANSPETIAVTDEPLPPITHADVTVDAGGRGVWLDGTLLGDEEPFDGLVLGGANGKVHNLSVHSFSRACIVAAGDGTAVGGDRAANKGNVVGGCSTGIALTGLAALAEGNTIGFGPTGDEPAPVGTGVLVTATDATVGGTIPGHGNSIAGAGTGIRVGTGTGPAVEGVVVRNNIFGGSFGPKAGEAVAVGVDLDQSSSGTSVRANQFVNVGTGIRVQADAEAQATGNTLKGNVFDNVAGMAIDLGGDGVQNANDDGDADSGANGLLNHGVITKAVQSSITGTAGVTCAGCKVELFPAAHWPGSPRVYGTHAIAETTVNDTGNFTFVSPPVSAGEWVTTLVHDEDGNTSEFGPSARVGAGVVQCANVPLQPGWNHSGYFGSSTLSLGSVYPPSSPAPGPVSAIYHLTDGSGSFTSWLSGSAVGRSLFALTPGEAYWFFAESPAASNGGFTLTAPVPVQLKAGWNDFVYIGAGADARDALSSIAGKFDGLYHFAPGPEGPQWTGFGDAETPDWARGFFEMEACGVYQVHVSEDVTLIPLQP